MKILLLLTAIYILSCDQRQKKVKEFPLLIEMFSPKSKLSLDLNNGKFSLEKNEFTGYDVILSDEITTGSYSIKNDIVIYESTVYPGCTEEDCVPVLEESSRLKYNIDFFCG